MIPILVVLTLTALAVIGILSLVIRRLLYVSAPNEALVFAGAARRVGDRDMGYAVVRGGRRLRVPLLERVYRIDLTMFMIDVSVQNAYCRGGIPLNVLCVANLKIAGDAPLLDNAIERFLGCDRASIMEVCRETLEGNLRGVLSQLTPEQVNEDKIRFAQTLIEEAEHDMHGMGLVLDTLKIQSVSDDVGYLSSIGRIRGASMRQGAAIAETSAKADAAVQKATNTMSSEVARIDADLEIARQQYRKRIADAVSKRTAMIAEAEGSVQAIIAQTKAEIERQKARLIQVERQLDADVVQPAEAGCKAAEEAARGNASRVIEQGRAQASALHELVEQYRKVGPAARDVFVMQKLTPLMTRISGQDVPLQVDKLTILPAAKPGESSDWMRQLIKKNAELRTATGTDVTDLIAKVAK